MSTVLYERNGLKVTECGDGPRKTRIEIVAADPTIFRDPYDVFDLTWHLNAWATRQVES